MDTTLEQYESVNRPLTALLDAVPADAWSRPSPCEDWTAAGVVGHLVETQRGLLSEHGVDLGPAPDVDRGPAAAWREHTGRVTRALADEALVTTAFDGYFGPTTLGGTLVQFYVWDMVAHRWDVATAVGVDAALTDAELDRVEAGIAAFGDALYMEGICKPAVEVPPGSDRATVLLARLGRPVAAPAGR